MFEFVESVNRCDVRMVRRGQELGFPLEARQPFGVSGERCGKNFACHDEAKLRVPGRVNLAHAAGANSLKHFVLTVLTDQRAVLKCLFAVRTGRFRKPLFPCSWAAIISSTSWRSEESVQTAVR
jgi:hypothetical protein